MFRRLTRRPTLARLAVFTGAAGLAVLLQRAHVDHFTYWTVGALVILAAFLLDSSLPRQDRQED